MTETCIRMMNYYHLVVLLQGICSITMHDRALDDIYHQKTSIYRHLLDTSVTSFARVSHLTLDTFIDRPFPREVLLVSLSTDLCLLPHPRRP